MKRILLASALLALLVAHPARADDICADRPTRSTGTCTVEPGHLQIETDLVDQTVQKQDGDKIVTTTYATPNFRFGLTKTLDGEIQFTPYVQVHDNSGTVGGFGDVYGRLKLKLLDTKEWQMAVEPWVKAPTANHAIGNGSWETGVLIPISWNLPHDFSLGIDPEVDIFKNQSGSGYHLNTFQVISLSHPFTKNSALYVELTADYNYDPARTVKQYTFDLGASVDVRPDLQIDGGVNWGLNRQTPSTEVYVGISKHF